MRLFDRYIGRQVFLTTLYAILMLTGILVLGNVFQRIRELIVDLGAPPSIILSFIVGVMPVSLIYTIPWAFLTAILLVFGRLSGDSEITAFRVAGIPLHRLALPVFVIGAALSILCLWLNIEIAPPSKSRSQDIVIRAFMEDPRSILSRAAEGDGLERMEENLKGVLAYIEKSDGSRMEGMHLFQLADPANPKSRSTYVHARRAETEIDDEKQEFRFHLYSALFTSTDRDGKPNIITSGEAVPLVLPYSIKSGSRNKPSRMTNREIRDFLAYNQDPKFDEETRLKRFFGEIHHRYASSFACLAFAIVGVPLAMKSRRRDTSSGLILSLVIGAIYFGTSTLTASSPASIIAVCWAPNLCCLLLGIYLFRRARFR